MLRAAPGTPLAVSPTGPAQACRTSAARGPPPLPPPPTSLPSEGALPVDVPRLRLQTYERLELLDRTPMSMVWRMRKRATGQIFAGKSIRHGCKIHLDAGHLNEVLMLRKLAEVPSIVRLQGVCDSDGEFWAILEYCAGGRLEPWLERFPGTASNIVRELFELVRRLHTLLICHLDIKPDNLLLTDAGSLRLCDFVTACQLQRPEQQMSGLCGTEGFRGPEVGRSAYSGLLADVYSLGKTLQAVARLDPTWRELTRASRQMAVDDPLRRLSLAKAATMLFGTGGEGGPSSGSPPAGGHPPLDLDALESVPCWKLPTSSGGAPFQSRTAHPAQPRPPDHQHPSAPLQTRAAIPKAESDTTPKVAAERARPSAPMVCGSVLCTRLGMCLCNDRASQAVGRMKPSARPGATNTRTRRSNTP